MLVYDMNILCFTQLKNSWKSALNFNHRHQKQSCRSHPPKSLEIRPYRVYGDLYEHHIYKNMCMRHTCTYTLYVVAISLYIRFINGGPL